ncbi:hypothetical protein NDU88_002706 [Pleurodeles waltl]|uniref:Uncharacterized protein n=1 Tax=Pleurodeles waltl TaxID=8319 RepID=A0AAV7UAI5_PLEWA|nr:hypothetical protein NDU88_002706 [Pleurodeles waltl]
MSGGLHENASKYQLNLHEKDNSLRIISAVIESMKHWSQHTDRAALLFEVLAFKALTTTTLMLTTPKMGVHIDTISGNDNSYIADDNINNNNDDDSVDEDTIETDTFDEGAVDEGTVDYSDTM